MDGYHHLRRFMCLNWKLFFVKKGYSMRQSSSYIIFNKNIKYYFLNPDSWITWGCWKEDVGGKRRESFSFRQVHYLFALIYVLCRVRKWERAVITKEWMDLCRILIVFQTLGEGLCIQSHYTVSLMVSSGLGSHPECTHTHTLTSTECLLETSIT